MSMVLNIKWWHFDLHGHFVSKCRVNSFTMIALSFSSQRKMEWKNAKMKIRGSSLSIGGAEAWVTVVLLLFNIYSYLPLVSFYVFFDRMLYLHFKFVFCCCQIFALCFCGIVIVVTLLSCCIYFRPISVQISTANRARLDRSDDVTGESSVCGTLPSAKIFYGGRTGSNKSILFI